MAANGQTDLIGGIGQPALAPFNLSECPARVGSVQRWEAVLALPVAATSTSGGGMANPVPTHRSGYCR